MRPSAHLPAHLPACQDPACTSYAMALLFYKGFHALQTHRVAHVLWKRGRKLLAITLQSRLSEVFGVDIHPAARIGAGVFVDHAVGLVVGDAVGLGLATGVLLGVGVGVGEGFAVGVAERVGPVVADGAGAGGSNGETSFTTAVSSASGAAS